MVGLLPILKHNDTFSTIQLRLGIFRLGCRFVLTAGRAGLTGNSLIQYLSLFNPLKASIRVHRCHSLA